MEFPQQLPKKRTKSIASNIFTTVGFISSVLTIALFTASSLTALVAWLIHEQTFVVPSITFAFGAGLSLVIFIIFKNRGSKQSEITQISSRVSYIESVIDGIKESRASVLLCVNTLDSSKKLEIIRLLQEALQEAKASGKDVRIIAPGGVDRVEAAYELTKVRGISMKFLSYLGDDDFRFTIIDSNVSIISIGIRDRPSNGCTIIISERLNSLLSKYSQELWSRPEAIEFDALLLQAIREIRDPTIPLTNKGLAARIGVPVSEIERILPSANNA